MKNAKSEKSMFVERTLCSSEILCVRSENRLSQNFGNKSSTSFKQFFLSCKSVKKRDHNFLLVAKRSLNKELWYSFSTFPAQPPWTFPSVPVEMAENILLLPHLVVEKIVP